MNDKKETIFTNQKIRKDLRIAESTLRRYHQLLIQEGYIKKRTDIKTESFAYEIIDVDEYKNLENTINNTLDECLVNVQKKAS